MKKNYLKCYFQAFGFLATLAALALFAVLGLAITKYSGQILKANYLSVVQGVVIVMLAGGALVGLAGLRKPKVGMADYIRVNFFLGGLVLAACQIGYKEFNKLVVIYLVASGVCFVEAIIRSLSITEEPTGVGMKGYFSAIGFRYNPMVLVLLAMVLSVLLAIGEGMELRTKFPIIASPYFKFYVIGGVLALLALLFIVSLEAESDAGIMDAGLSIVFMGCLFSVVGLANRMTSSQIKYLLLVLVGSGVGILARSVFYDRNSVYDNNLHKMKTYFRVVYGKYSVFSAILIAGIVIACSTIALTATQASVALASSTKPCNLYLKLDKYVLQSISFIPQNVLVLLCVIVPLVLVVLFLVLVVIFRGFSSTEPIKTDWFLTTLICMTAFAIPALISILLSGSLAILKANTLLLVLFITYAVCFVISIVLQIVRIMNFDPMASIIAAEAQQRMTEKKEAKAIEKAQKEAAEREAELNKPYDPFALTEEDEAIYEAEFGQEEKKKEEPVVEGNPYEEEEVEEVEEVVEETEEVEVVEEQTTSDDDDFEAFISGMAEKKEEEPQKAAPQAVAEDAEEDDEDSEEEAEDEAEDAEDEAEEEEDSEPVEEVVHEQHKEAAIEVQEFVAVDEDGQPKKIKRKFTTKMMFAPYETKEYYNEIKNYLMMYRAKGRNSSRCESFRYKGLVSKVALGGKAVKVFLALDPSIIEQYPKYHLKNVSEKKQYAEVPVMIKVRSDRSLKYFKELVDLMFANRLVKPKRNYEPTNFIPQLIPNGEAILGNLGMSTYYLQNSMNVNGIPEEMPNDLVEYLPMIPGDELEEEETEAVAYLDTLCAHFEEGDEITLDVLKSMHICQKGNVLRIKARGTLDRKLIIYAEKFDDDALKMLMCTNGTAIRIVR